MFEFKHPKYYKNLRKLYRSRNRDQAISLQAETSDARRTPGTGQMLPDSTMVKQRATSSTSRDQERPSSQAGGRVGPKGSSLQAREQASAQASSGARINKR